MKNLTVRLKAPDITLEDGELLKDIRGFEGRYKISNYGRIISYPTNNIKGRKHITILQSHKDNNGYMAVSLYKNNKVYSYQVHRLLAIAFIPNPNNYQVVNHKDENKLNNTISNLEWCTTLYNNRYSKVQSRMISSKMITISKIKEGKLIACYKSLRCAARCNGLSVSAMLNRVTKKLEIDSIIYCNLAGCDIIKQFGKEGYKLFINPIYDYR